jgi:hypothetical protein
VSLELGSKLGYYEILAPLGAGGMGEVYRATDTKLHRDVAIKEPRLFDLIYCRLAVGPTRSAASKGDHITREWQGSQSVTHSKPSGQPSAQTVRCSEPHQMRSPDSRTRPHSPHAFHCPSDTRSMQPASAERLGQPKESRGLFLFAGRLGGSARPIIVERSKAGQ